MMWNDAFFYERILARDSAYDGRFITGVLSTGIYCLPSCTARKPKPENVRFFKHEPEAIAAGLRPCLRCRPDLFYRGDNQDRDLFHGLLARLRAAPAAFPDIAAMSAAAGISTTKLTELTRLHAHLPPASLLRRIRVDAACEKLLLSGARAIDIAFETGFRSESTFHRQFLAQTGLAPGDYRALRAANQFLLKLPPAYRHAETLAYHGRDAQGRSERVDGSRFYKTLPIGGGGVLEIALENAGAFCRAHLAEPVAPTDMAAIHGIALRLLGLYNDPADFEARASREPEVARLVAARRGLRLPLTANPFEALVWAIIGQQINLAFATSLRRALIEHCGKKIPGTDLRIHPSADAIAALEPAELGRLRFSGAKAGYLIETARAVASGKLPLATLGHASAHGIEAGLKSIRGVGPWTTHYTLLRGFGFGDCLLAGDSGLATGLQRFLGLERRPKPDETTALMERFAPHRSFATCHLWASLGDAT